MPIEIVNLRLTASGDPRHISCRIDAPVDATAPCEHTWLQELNKKVPVYQRTDIGQTQVISGPSIILESHATVYIAPHWQASLHGSGGLLLERMDIK